MKTRTNVLLVVVALPAVFAAAWLIWQLNVSASAANTALREASAENATLREQLQNRGRQDDTAPRTQEQIAVAEASRSEASKAAAKKRQQDMQAYRLAFYERLDKDPAYQMKYYSAQRAYMDTAYGPFVHMHHLSVEQKEAVFSAMLQKQLRYDRVPLIYVERQLPVSDPTLARQLMTEADKEYKDSIQVAIGDALATELERYERVRQDWSRVGDFAANLAIAGTPINLVQASQLVDAFSGSKKDNQIDWDVVDARAREILDEEQFEYFHNVESLLSKYMGELEAAFQKLDDESKEKTAVGQ